MASTCRSPRPTSKSGGKRGARSRPISRLACRRVFYQNGFSAIQVTGALLSRTTLGVFPRRGQPPRAPQNFTESQIASGLTAAQTAAVRDFVNKLAGSQRMLAHGQLYPGVANLPYMEQQIADNKPDSWKGYTVSTSAKVDFDPHSPMRMWRLDDEAAASPPYGWTAHH